MALAQWEELPRPSVLQKYNYFLNYQNYFQLSA
nr:MAG TPA: hypothetical protein [Caudoviricetes sp.]